MRSKKRVRVAIVGVGNCASSLVQGVEFYRHTKAGDFSAGLMHPDLGGYEISDIEFSAAFDVNTFKVGVDLSSAISQVPNNTIRFARVPKIGLKVHRGPTLDGLGKYLKRAVFESKKPIVDVARVLRATKTDVVVSYLPVGAQKATEWYVEQAIKARCGFVNCVPVFIASNPKWQKKFEQANLPIIGDDIKSQVGATIVHRVLTDLFQKRGVRLDRTYQLNCGGNADFLNMIERERLESKKISKTAAVMSQLPYELHKKDVHVGPSDYIAWLEDRKICFISMEGTAFGYVPLKCELKLEVWDSPNSAGVVIDAVRSVKLAMDRGLGGALMGPSAYLMKSPPKQVSDAAAYGLMEAFIVGGSSTSARSSR